MERLTVGDKAPPLIGASANGRFFSQDLQAGRPVLLAALGLLSPDAARRLLDRLHAVHAAIPIDIIALAPPAAAYASAFATSEGRDRVIHIHEGTVFEGLSIDGCPALIVLDRNWRIVHIGPFEARMDLAALVAALAPRLGAEPPRICASAAPVLVLPNVMSLEACRGLIAHFEQSVHSPGVMASVRAGAPTAKHDESKKRRRDLELSPETPLHGEVLHVLAERCAPEIKRCFQANVAYADRILIARYDDSGGYFKRHRDNLTPQTAFREFAVSINLNTDDYDGGELLFPEFNDHRYNPPAGGAIVFSASLLHEAASVTRGRRYVALSFLSSMSAQGRITEAA